MVDVRIIMEGERRIEDSAGKAIVNPHDQRS